MAFYADVDSSKTRLSIFILIVLLYFCISSSTASLFDSSRVNINEMNEKKDLFDEINPSLPSLIDYYNGNENEISSQERLLNLLLTSARIQEENFHRFRPSEIRLENRRNVPQSFHAMRG